MKTQRTIIIALFFLMVSSGLDAASATKPVAPPTKPNPGAPAAPTAVNKSSQTEELFNSGETRPSKINLELGISLFIASLAPDFAITDPAGLPGTDLDRDILGFSAPAINFEIRPSIYYKVGRNEVGFGIGMMMFPTKSGSSTLTQDLRIGDKLFQWDDGSVGTPDGSITSKISYSQFDIGLSYRIIQPRGRVQIGVSAVFFDLETVVKSWKKQTTTQIGGIAIDQAIPAFDLSGDYNIPGMRGKEWKIEGRFLMAIGETSSINAEFGINYRYSQLFNIGFGYRLLSFNHDGKTVDENFDATMTLLQHGPQFKINMGF